MLTDLVVRLRAILRRPAVERELDDELRFHLDHEIDRYVGSGMSRADAERRARLEFGGVEQVREDCRDARGVGMIDELAQDVRYGWRTMRHSPVFSVTAVLTIALSTGALATVFTLAHTLFFRPLAVDRPGEVVVVSATRGGPRTGGAVSYPDYVTFRDRTTTLSGLAAHYPTAPLFVTVNRDAKEMNGAVVTSNYFPLLGLTPELGRFFHADEDRVPDRDRVAVIGHGLWRDAFGGSVKAIGAMLTINGVAFTVVGVAPPTVVAVTPIPIEVYIPTMMLRAGYRWCDDALAASCTTLSMIGRLAPGRTMADAAAEFPTLMPAYWTRAPKGENSGVVVTERRGMSEDDSEPQLVRLLAGVAIALLLVACANLGGLLSAQSAARAPEFGIRLALGAGARRIVRQVMTESLMLAGAGGVAGVVLSRGMIGILAAAFFGMDDEGHPLRYDFGLTPAIAVATLAAALAAGGLFSVIPALGAVRRQDAGRATRSSTARWSSGRWLLGAQVAAAVALVAVAGLLAANARTLLVGRNYDAGRVALMRVRPRLVKYSPERAQRFQRDVVRRLASVPSVESVSMVGVGAVLGGGSAVVALPGWTDGRRANARYNEIGPRYFETLRTPMADGREFDDRDGLRSPRVAIVNETLAARLWPAGGAIGATLLVQNVPHEVVGIVTDVLLVSRTHTVDAWVYVPFWQNPGQIDSRLAIRVAGDPAALLPVLAREVNRVDPDVPIAETITLPVRMAGLTRPVRVSAVFVGYTAALALLLAAIGLYGTLAFSVSRRTKEMGIRLALGAARARVSGLIVREGMSVAMAGAIAGVGLAAAGSRLVEHLLYRSATPDWMFYAAAALLILAVGLLASLIPARRAAAVEPLVALRHD